MSAYEDWKARRLYASPDVMGGALVFRGSRLTVRNVAGQLARGVTEAELLADYPYLQQEDFDNARVFIEKEGTDG